MSKLETKITIESGKNKAIIKFTNKEVTIDFIPVVKITDGNNTADECFCLQAVRAIYNEFKDE